jgi:23S rRNA (cytidine1920-2'-O)/16S rRNA (cytidine1409-2'-O)-methyltransferase
MRLDSALVERGLANTRSKAVHLIKSGDVRVNGEEVRRQSHEVRPDDVVEIGSGFRYVGRGGYKLEGLVRKAGLAIAGRTVLDVGCSTGGFTDFFLQHGAARVVAVDVAKDPLHPSLRSDPRVEF